MVQRVSRLVEAGLLGVVGLACSFGTRDILLHIFLCRFSYLATKILGLLTLGFLLFRGVLPEVFRDTMQ